MSEHEIDPALVETEAGDELTRQDLRQRIIDLERQLTRQSAALETAKTALKESEERFSQIAGMTGEWIWEQDVAGRYLYCSGGVNAILGYDRQELIGRFCYEFSPPEDEKALRLKLNKSAETLQGFQRFIRRYQHRNDSLVFTESTAVPICNAHGHLLKWRGIDRDVTATRRADELVFKLSRALEQSPNAILISDLDGIIEYVNPAFTRLTGYSAEEVVGKSPRLLQSGKTSLEQYRRLWETITAGREWREEIQDRKKNGEFYWALETIAPIRNAAGTSTHFLAIQQDITERKRAEMALRESETRTRLIIQSALDAIILMDAEERITDWNPQAEKIFGWSREEVLGWSLAETIIPPQYREAHRQGLRRFLDTGEGPMLKKRIEFTALHRDGHEFPVELTVSPLQVSGSYVFSGFLRDLTQRKEAEEAIRRARVKLAVTHNEMRIAQQIQASLLPSAPLLLPTVQIMGYCLPATHIGGDYFDYYQWQDGTVDIVIADVSGHSVGPALLMAETRSALKAQFRLHESVANTLSGLNDVLYEDLDRADHFITMCYLRYDARGGQLVYANAGHIPPLLFRQGQPWQPLEADGLVLGVKMDLAFEERAVALQKGDMLFLYTDGIIEAEDASGEFFGVHRLCSLLEAHRGAEPQEIITAIIERLRAFCHRKTFEDDVTMVVMQVL